MKIKTIKDLFVEAENYDGYDDDFNEELVDSLIKGDVPRKVFLEYLEITQGDIMDCLTEAQMDCDL